MQSATKANYVGFFDLLGIKELIEYEPARYADTIFEFRNVLLNACAEIKYDDFAVYFYSDCAYIETSDLKSAIDFYKQLRKKLFDNDIFFKGALGTGTLKATLFNGGVDKVDKLELVDEKNELKAKLKGAGNKAKGILFEDQSIAKIYTAQAILKGIGINVNTRELEILIGENIGAKKLFKNSFCKSIYLADDKGEKIVDYHDLKLSEEEINPTNFKKFIQLYFITNSKDKRLGKYYLSYFSTLINSMNFEDLEFNPESHVFYFKQNPKRIDNNKTGQLIMDALLDKTKFLSFNRLYEQAVGVEILYIVLLNKIYIDKGDEVSSAPSTILEIIFDHFNKVSNRFLFNLNKIPASILYADSRLKLLRDYNDLISQLNTNEKQKIKKQIRR